MNQKQGLKLKTFCNLNKIRYDLLDYSVDSNINCKKYWCNDKDNIVKKHSKDSKSINEIMNQIEMIRNT